MHPNHTRRLKAQLLSSSALTSTLLRNVIIVSFRWTPPYSGRLPDHAVEKG